MQIRVRRERGAVVLVGTRKLRVGRLVRHGDDRDAGVDQGPRIAPRTRAYLEDGSYERIVGGTRDEALRERMRSLIQRR